MAFALGIIIRDKLLALADKVTARLNAGCDLDGDCEGNRICAVRNPAGAKGGISASQCFCLRSRRNAAHGGGEARSYFAHNLSSASSVESISLLPLESGSIA
jgi:hypothetical protein